MALGTQCALFLMGCSLVVGCAIQQKTQVPTTENHVVASAIAPVASGVVASAVTVKTPAPAVVSDVDSEAYEFRQKDRDALLLNAFNEARGESSSGIRAVLGVTMARVASVCYPKTVHDVVYQPKQFSWTWQRGTIRSLAAAKAEEPATYARVKSVVDEFIADGAKPSDAVLYHATSVNPAWARSSKVARVKVLGEHVFYEDRSC